MKKNLNFLKENFEDFFKIIPKIFKEYFPKRSHKSSQKVGGCGSCYSVCTHHTHHDLRFASINNVIIIYNEK